MLQPARARNRAWRSAAVIVRSVLVRRGSRAMRTRSAKATKAAGVAANHGTEPTLLRTSADGGIDRAARSGRCRVSRGLTPCLDYEGDAEHVPAPSTPPKTRAREAVEAPEQRAPRRPPGACKPR